MQNTPKNDTGPGTCHSTKPQKTINSDTDFTSKTIATYARLTARVGYFFDAVIYSLAVLVGAHVAELVTALLGGAA
jgi:hypothetical protein